MDAPSGDGRGGARPLHRAPLAAKLSFSQFASQPTASQALSAAMRGCHLTTASQRPGGCGGGAVPPPPRFGDPAPAARQPAPPLDDEEDPLDEDDGAGPDVPLSQLPQATPADAGAFMLG